MKNIKKMEVHVHTRYSRDSLLNYALMLFMLKIKKISIVAITDHNEIKGALDFRQKLIKHNIKCIVGEEINTTKGEIIGLFIKEKINPGMSPKETMVEIKKQGGIVYIPHPFDKMRYRTVLDINEIYNNIDLIDLIEVCNGRTIDTEDIYNSYSLCEDIKKIPCVGSDSHIFFELGRNYVEIEDFNTRQEFLDNIKTAKFVNNKCIKISHKITKGVKFIKYLKEGKIHELYRIINKKCKRRINKISRKN